MATQRNTGQPANAERHRVGCQARVHALYVDGRYFRWRCTDRNCEAVQEAKRQGAWAFHVFDTVTHTITDELETPHRQAG
jgi:hypothetical protein